MIFLAKFKFKLQSFLSVKEKIEEMKKLEYRKAIALLELENQELLRHTGNLSTQIDEFRVCSAQKVNPRKMLEYNAYIEQIKVLIVKQQAKIDKASSFVEIKRLELVEAVSNRKMLENLKEKDLEEFLKEQQIAEGKLVDEIISYKYGSQKA